MRLRNAGVLCAVGALAAGWLASSASGAVMFTKITDNGNENVSNQLLLGVNDYGTEVGLKLTNSGPIASTVAAFYVEDTNDRFDAITDYIGTGVVSFSAPPPGPGDLPSGQNVGFLCDFTATADPSPATNGVDPGEMLEVRLSLAGGATSADVLADLMSGEMRIGLHVISIGLREGSEAFVTPTPGTIALSACAIGYASLRRRRSR